MKRLAVSTIITERLAVIVATDNEAVSSSSNIQYVDTTSNDEGLVTISDVNVAEDWTVSSTSSQ